MDGAIQIKDLLLFVIFCLVVTAGVFLIIMLYNFTQFIKKANKILEANSENLHNTLVLLPEATKNVNDVAISIKHNMEKVEETIGGVESAVAETVATVSEGAENLLNYVKIISDIVNIVLGVFTSKKN
ncbi:MAG: hypothetical protein N2484_05295 [Clostridia bacterium]|nr:hypothetical protein [Clostridia bacterium]